MNAVTILESDWNAHLETVKVLDAKVNAIASLLKDLKFQQAHAGEDALSGVIRYLIKRKEETTPFFPKYGEGNDAVKKAEDPYRQQSRAFIGKIESGQQT